MWKIKYKLKKYWYVTLRDTFSPLYEKDKIFSILTIPIFILLSFEVGDLKKDIFNLGKTGTAILATFPIWFLINLFLSPFKYNYEEKLIGSWIKNKFNYHTPCLVHVSHVTPEDNGKFVKIPVKQAEPESFCLFKVVCEGGISEATITLHEKNTHFWGQFNRENNRVGVRINKNKKTKLIFNCPKNSDQTTVRVYLLNWEK